MTFRSTEPLLKGQLSYFFEILLTMDINSSTYHKTRHIAIIVIFDPKPSLSEKGLSPVSLKGGPVSQMANYFSRIEARFPEWGTLFPLQKQGPL